MAVAGKREEPSDSETSVAVAGKREEPSDSETSVAVAGKREEPSVAVAAWGAVRPVPLTAWGGALVDGKRNAY